MKKLLILILIGLLLALGIFVAWEGIGIGKLNILGIQGIQDKNAELEQQIAQATKLASTDYKKAVSTVEDDAKNLKKEKQKYEEMTTIASDSEIQEAAQLPTYEIEYLWTKIGNHATSEGAIIKMDIAKGTNTIQNTYNLKFTVNGSYISITDFISDIENDSSLGFKIEEFNMIPTSDTAVLQATFVCKDITIKDLSQATVTTDDTEDTEDNTNETNTKNDNTANTTNTTNTTNKANTTNNTNNQTTNNTTDNTAKK